MPFKLKVTSKLIVLQCITLLLFYTFYKYANNQQILSNSPPPRTKFYNEDLGSLPHFPNINFFPTIQEEPYVTAILDAHDVRKDENYHVHSVARYKAWGPKILTNGGRNERRYYLAQAGVKGWGVFADEFIPNDSLVGVYTGYNIAATDATDTKYARHFLSYAIDMNGR
jgi:hypothetical protein